MAGDVLQRGVGKSGRMEKLSKEYFGKTDKISEKVMEKRTKSVKKVMEKRTNLQSRLCKEIRRDKQKREAYGDKSRKFK